MFRSHLLAGIAAAALVGGTSVALAAGGSSWGYQGAKAPSNWGTLSADYATCGTGVSQSPINIDTATATPTALDPVVNTWQELPLAILNNGHTIQVNAAPGSTVEVGGKTYNLAQFHFHHPSEHTFDGNYTPMEVHFVHMAPDGKSAAVVGVMIDVGEANPVMQQIWDAAPDHAGEVTVDATVDPNGLLPADLGYYNYSGSLTTPPCSEIINWVVLKTPITASAAQIAQFAALFPINARPTQPVNDRTVAASQ